MTELLHWVFKIVLILGITFSIVFIVYSIIENEKYAVKKNIPILLILAVLLVISFVISIPNIFQFLFVAFFLTVVFLVVLPFGNFEIQYKIPKNKFDERDVMFSRINLKEGSKEFNSYYRVRPKNKIADDLFRKEPGLLTPGSKFYSKYIFNAADATFSTVDLLQPLVEQKAKQATKEKFDPKDISTFLKKWAIKLGAKSVGFTLLQPHHIYSHVGRGADYGKDVKLDHKFAIAFTVVMDHDFINCAPKGTVIMESAQQYLNAGNIAVQLTQFIRNMGFEARAHIDANYRIICPVVAQDAGLGTIGRMGLLMTPKLGPRVRIAVVTTNLKLNVNTKPHDSTVIQFCESCKKCASNCPSQSISFNSAKNNKEWRRWRINHEKCFTYWSKIGTDCGKCMAVCPYSHPDNFLHNLVRWMIRQNSFNRWLALKLDDFFYGRKPASKPVEKWML
ncbi:MAG: 4Fe-4S dicluster domain-containing protein [Prolixibacteraceae bacterium]|nr:4Fe-4S dicluster domain-containing protein [Prolixibacteraceae bacterium]